LFQPAQKNKSLFASFSSEKEDSSFLKERSKELLFPGLVCVAAFLFFARRARFGLWALGFGDETMHLLGGWALDSGERLYKNFVDLHGPGIFMLAQIYGALFGFDHANNARLVIAGLAVLAGAAVGTSPALRGASRACAAALYFGLLATVWLTQGLYLFSYYPISGAFTVIALAWFVVPAIARAPIPAALAAIAGIACALLAFTSYSEAPSALLFSAGGCLAAWQGGQARAARAHLAGFVAAGILLAAWLAIWGDILGYLTFHVLFAAKIYQQVGPLSLRGLLMSLTPSSQPDRLVQGAAVIFAAIGSLAALILAVRAGSGRVAAVFAVLASALGLVLLNIRGLSIFQDGAMLVGAIGWFALAGAAAIAGIRPRTSHPIWAGAACIAIVAITDGVLRHAVFSPPPMTRAQFLAQPYAPIAARGEGPLFDAIRRLTRPDERILALVYRPEIYFGAGRRPIDRFYEYLPTDAIYARAPFFGEQRDLCAILETSPPKVIVFDNWAVWGIYKPIDYMPCLFKALAAKYKHIPEPGDEGAEAAKLYVRNDLAPG
jgi:hypothetical protein